MSAGKVDAVTRAIERAVEEAPAALEATLKGAVKPNVLAVLDAVLSDLAYVARRGRGEFRHDQQHQDNVREARVAVAELIEAAAALITNADSDSGTVEDGHRLGNNLRAALARIGAP